MISRWLFNDAVRARTHTTTHSQAIPSHSQPNPDRTIPLQSSDRGHLSSQPGVIPPLGPPQQPSTVTSTKVEIYRRSYPGKACKISVSGRIVVIDRFVVNFLTLQTEDGQSQPVLPEEASTGAMEPPVAVKVAETIVEGLNRRWKEGLTAIEEHLRESDNGPLTEALCAIVNSPHLRELWCIFRQLNGFDPEEDDQRGLKKGNRRDPRRTMLLNTRNRPLGLNPKYLKDILDVVDRRLLAVAHSVRDLRSSRALRIMNIPAVIYEAMQLNAITLRHVIHTSNVDHIGELDLSMLGHAYEICERFLNHAVSVPAIKSVLDELMRSTSRLLVERVVKAPVVARSSTLQQNPSPALKPPQLPSSRRLRQTNRLRVVRRRLPMSRDPCIRRRLVETPDSTLARHFGLPRITNSTRPRSQSTALSDTFLQHPANSQVTESENVDDSQIVPQCHGYSQPVGIGPFREPDYSTEISEEPTTSLKASQTSTTTAATLHHRGDNPRPPTVLAPSAAKSVAGTVASDSTRPPNTTRTYQKTLFSVGIIDGPSSHARGCCADSSSSRHPHESKGRVLGAVRHPVMVTKPSQHPRPTPSEHLLAPWAHLGPLNGSQPPAQSSTHNHQGHLMAPGGPVRGSQAHVRAQTRQAEPYGHNPPPRRPEQKCSECCDATSLDALRYDEIVLRGQPDSSYLAPRMLYALEKSLFRSKYSGIAGFRPAGWDRFKLFRDLYQQWEGFRRDSMGRVLIIANELDFGEATLQSCWRLINAVFHQGTRLSSQPQALEEAVLHLEQKISMRQYVLIGVNAAMMMSIKVHEREPMSLRCLSETIVKAFLCRGEESVVTQICVKRCDIGGQRKGMTSSQMSPFSDAVKVFCRDRRDGTGTVYDECFREWERKLMDHLGSTMPFECLERQIEICEFPMASDIFRRACSLLTRCYLSSSTTPVQHTSVEIGTLSIYAAVHTIRDRLPRISNDSALRAAKFVGWQPRTFQGWCQKSMEFFLDHFSRPSTQVLRHLADRYHDDFHRMCSADPSSSARS